MIINSIRKYVNWITLEKTLCALVAASSFHYFTARDLIDFGYLMDLGAGIIPSILFIISYFYCARYFLTKLCKKSIALLLPNLPKKGFRTVYSESLKCLTITYLMISLFLITFIFLIRLGGVSASLAQFYSESNLFLLAIFAFSYIYLFIKLRHCVPIYYRIIAVIIIIVGIIFSQLIGFVAGFILMILYSILGMIFGGGDW